MKVLTIASWSLLCADSNIYFWCWNSPWYSSYECFSLRLHCYECHCALMLRCRNSPWWQSWQRCNNFLSLPLLTRLEQHGCHMSCVLIIRLHHIGGPWMRLKYKLTSATRSVVDTWNNGNIDYSWLHHDRKQRPLTIHSVFCLLSTSVNEWFIYERVEDITLTYCQNQSLDSTTHMNILFQLSQVQYPVCKTIGGK